jgi:superfamily I DNA/RNA helicase
MPKMVRWVLIEWLVQLILNGRFHPQKYVAFRHSPINACDSQVQTDKIHDQDILKSQNAIDFDDLLLKVYGLFNDYRTFWSIFCYPVYSCHT